MMIYDGPDEDEQEPGDADSEDLEQEALLARREDEEDEPEYGPPEEEEGADYDRFSDLDTAGMEDLKEACASGRRAKTD